MHGESVSLRLTCTPDGRVEARARSAWHTDVGSRSSGPNTDLHGQVLIESRTTDSRRPLRLAFRLHGIQVGFLGTVHPMLTEGAIELTLGTLAWSAAVASPVLPQPGGEVPAAVDLREVRSVWPAGHARSHGWLDAAGRRHGVWTTWYADGTKQSASGFLHGERHGAWTSHWEHGGAYEVGRFDDGLREGEWIERWGPRENPTTTRGRYVAGRKDGEWVERWADGSPRARGSFEGGRESGPWTRWWPNGNKLCEGTYDGGYGVGEWTYWNEDGSVRKVETRRKPPWAQE